MNGAFITGWGSALPDQVVTNDDLAKTMDTNDTWIRERTGIRERRVGGTTSGLSTEAGRRAIESAGLEPSDINLLVLATTSPDQTCPGTAPTVQDALGLECGAFDVGAACSGFVYALVTAFGFVGQGLDNILVIGAETLDRITDYTDRVTGILFGNGAGAVVLQSTKSENSLLGWDLGSHGFLRKAIFAEVGGYLQMDGKEIFRRAARLMVNSAHKSLERAGVTTSDIALVVPHQANIRIIEAASKRLGIPMSRTATVLETTGNTSAASIPLALVDAVDKGRLKKGDLVLLVGFGAGMTTASAVIRWDPTILRG
ncbi:MAG: 3-oxoacyl-[acyl-carrier-protein] synthase-3 [Pseudohongiellaceae bacterium]|jgi:3-oxoacyl-[acyl-carrier-protein] synthase-3